MSYQPPKEPVAYCPKCRRPNVLRGDVSMIREVTCRRCRVRFPWQDGPKRTDGELNPNHPTTQSVSGHWHKYLALVMWKFNELHVVISPEDVQAFLDSGVGAVTIKDGEAGDQCIHLRLVTYAEGERLAREEGGLPA